MYAATHASRAATAAGSLAGSAASLASRIAPCVDRIVGRVAHQVDGARDAVRLLRHLGTPARGQGETEQQRQHTRAARHGAEHRAQSAGFGGGPIWMRSPMYDPMSVNMTPMSAMIAYMKNGMVRTVCPLAR